MTDCGDIADPAMGDPIRPRIRGSADLVPLPKRKVENKPREFYDPPIFWHCKRCSSRNYAHWGECMECGVKKS